MNRPAAEGRRPDPEPAPPVGGINIPARWIQLAAILILRSWFRLVFRMTVIRRAPRPHGAVLYVANHRSFADPAMATIWSAEPVAFFARASLWRILPIRFFLDVFGGIPVDRANPSASSMKGAIERLRAGWSVLVFPEGTRTRTGRLGRLREGPALFARRSGAPVVPIYLHRSEAVWPRGWILPAPWGARARVIFGPPLRAPADLPVRERDAWLSARIAAWLHREERRWLRLPAATRTEHRRP